jgi:hypothetical protein
MPEIGTSDSMSGDGKRSVGHRPQATAPILDSTRPAADKTVASLGGRFLGSTCRPCSWEPCKTLRNVAAERKRAELEALCMEAKGWSGVIRASMAVAEETGGRRRLISAEWSH